MERIDKSRKGMPFRFMTKDEQMLLLEKADIFFYKDDWIPIKERKIVEDISYWNSDWDELIGEELVGKLCVDEHENYCVLANGKYADFGLKYKQVKLSEIKDMIDMER